MSYSPQYLQYLEQDLALNHLLNKLNIQEYIDTQEEGNTRNSIPYLHNQQAFYRLLVSINYTRRKLTRGPLKLDPCHCYLFHGTATHKLTPSLPPKSKMLLEDRRHNKIAIEANSKRKKKKRKEEKPALVCNSRTLDSGVGETETERLQCHTTGRTVLLIWPFPSDLDCFIHPKSRKG